MEIILVLAYYEPVCLKNIYFIEKKSRNYESECFTNMSWYINILSKWA